MPKNMDDEVGEINVSQRMVENHQYLVLMSIFLAISMYLIRLSSTVDESIKIYVNLGIASGFFLSFYIFIELLSVIFWPIIRNWSKGRIPPEVSFETVFDVVLVGTALIFLILGVFVYVLATYPEILLYHFLISYGFGFIVFSKFFLPKMAKISFRKSLIASFALILASGVVNFCIMLYLKQLIFFSLTLSGFVWAIILFLLVRAGYAFYLWIKKV